MASIQLSTVIIATGHLLVMAGRIARAFGH